jgi:hypothetical protein
MPKGSIFNKLTFANADVTTAGIQFGAIKSIECPSETSRLEETFKLIEYYDYDTIWSRKLVQPTSTTKASTLDNSFCTPEEESAPGKSQIHFFIKSFYYRDIRYPQSIMSGLSEIGGLIAIFKIGLILSYFHQMKFERTLVAKLEQQNRNSKIDLDEAKKMMSIENYHRMACEYKGQIEELKRQNEQMRK